MFFRLPPLESIQKKTEDQYIEPRFNPAEYSQWEVQRERIVETPQRVRKYIPYGEVLVDDHDIDTQQTTKRKMPIHGPVYMGTVVQDNIGEDWQYDLNQQELEQRLKNQELYVDSQTLINIKFIKVLGSGAFGTVYEIRAEEKPIEEEENTLSPPKGKEYQLACKVVRPQSGTIGSVEQALNEMRILRYLRHQNICNFKDITGIKDRETGFQYAIICMFFELCDGDLQTLRLQNQPQDLIGDWVLSEQLSRHWFKQIVRGLEYIHSNGIVHRDLKEQNILFRYGNYFGNDFDKRFLLSTFKLTDFGISREDSYQSEQHHDISGLLNILFLTTIPGPKPYWQQFYTKCQTGQWTDNDPQEWNEVSIELKDLMGRMARVRNRMTASQILEHNWVNVEEEILFEDDFTEELPELPKTPKAFTFDNFQNEFPPFHRDLERGRSQMSSDFSRSSSFGSIPELIKDFDLETHPWFYDILHESYRQPKNLYRQRSFTN